MRVFSLLLVLLLTALLSSCATLDTGDIGDASEKVGKGVGIAKTGEGIKQLGIAQVEKQKTKQKVIEKNAKKTELASKVLSGVENEKLRIELAKATLSSNEKIEIAREKTKQVQAEASKYSNYAIGAGFGVMFSALGVSMFGIARRTSIKIGS